MRFQRSKAVHQACAETWNGDGSLDIVRDGHRLVFEAQPDYIYGADGQIIGVDAWVRLFGPDGVEIPVDPHRRIVNPPLVPLAGVELVPSEEDPDALVRVLTPDPAAAFVEAVWDSVRAAPNPAGWNTRGTVTTFFADVADGRIDSEDDTYSNARSGSSLAAFTGGTASICGQEHSSFAFLYNCSQVFISFDTAAINDSDIISAVTLDMWLESDDSTTDFITEVRDKDWGSSLTTADFVAGASIGGQTLVASINSSGIGSTGAYKTFTSETAFASMGNLKTGVIRLMLSSSRQRLGNAPDENTTEYLIWALADTSGTSNDPKLTVTHTPASTPATATPAAIAVAAAIPAPSISTGVTVTPTTIAATATMPAPTASGGATPTPATIAAVATIPAPTILTGGSVTVAVDTIAAVATVPDPVIARGTTVTPATIAAVATVLTPSVLVPVDVTVSPATIEAIATVLPPVLDLPLLPGALIDRDGQLEFDGFLMGGGTPYRLQQLTGWDDTPGIDNGNTPRSAQHGAWSGRKLAQERYVTFTGLIRGPKSLFADYVDAFTEGTPISEDEEELPLAIRTLSGVTRLAYGHIINRSLPLDKDYRQGLGRIAVQWVCSDPRRYGIDIQSSDLARGGTIAVTNIGNTPTHPTLRINGPCTDPLITIVQSGRKLGFGVALTAGQYIDIDCRRGTALFNGTTNVLAGRTAGSVPPQLFVFPRGASTVTYTATGATVPVADVLWRDAWM